MNGSNKALAFFAFIIWILAAAMLFYFYVYDSIEYLNVESYDYSEDLLISSEELIEENYEEVNEEGNDEAARMNADAAWQADNPDDFDSQQILTVLYITEEASE